MNAASKSSLSRRCDIPAPVRAPKRRLSREAESALSPRQLEILDVLEEWILRGGFADVTMAEIAKRAGCSMRTLYGIAPSKDALVLTLLDRRLHRIGREAIRALDLDKPPFERPTSPSIRIPRPSRTISRGSPELRLSTRPMRLTWSRSRACSSTRPSRSRRSVRSTRQL